MPRVAFNPNSSLHQLDEACADCEAEAGAAVLSRRGAVSLRERLKDRLQFLRWDPNSGVLHRKMQNHPVR